MNGLTEEALKFWKQSYDAGTARVKLEVVGFYGDGKNYQNTGSLNSPPSVSNSKNWGSGVSGAIITAGISSSNEASKNSANFGKISQSQQSFEGGSFMVQIGAFKRPEGAKSFKYIWHLPTLFDSLSQ